MVNKQIPKSVVDKMFTPNIDKLFSIFQEYGFSTRLVGGAVRDVLLGLNPRDIDIATSASPDEAIYILEEEFSNLGALSAWGIRHGTIIVDFEGADPPEAYEISSLDFSITVVNKKISIAQHATWEEDAERRDFSVNSMSMDRQGKVFDYTGGIKDLEQQRIRFLGDYQKKIIDDPKLILRFFKLIAKFSKPKYDKEYIQFMTEHIQVMQQMRESTIKVLLMAIKTQTYGQRALHMIRDIGLNIQDYMESRIFQQYIQMITA